MNQDSDQEKSIDYEIEHDAELQYLMVWAN